MAREAAIYAKGLQRRDQGQPRPQRLLAFQYGGVTSFVPLHCPLGRD